MYSVVVLGAGSIGCFLGAALAQHGAHVTLVGRPRVLDGIRSQGLKATDFLGNDYRPDLAKLTLCTEPPQQLHNTLVLVAVKSAATEQVAQQLTACSLQNSTVISFQNGIYNADILKAALPNTPVFAGMVPYNVVEHGPGHFHRGSAGNLEVESGPLAEHWSALFDIAQMPLTRPDNMRATQWGKLLINLNNSVNALSGIPLKSELSQRAYRRCVALAISEGLNVLDAAGIEPAKATPLPPRALPWLMNTPDWVFTNTAKRILAIDPLARSSMWEDLCRGRPTEIDWINGEVVKLGQKHGLRCPVNSKLIELIRQAEQGGRRDYTGPELLALLQQAAGK